MKSSYVSAEVSPEIAEAINTAALREGVSPETLAGRLVADALPLYLDSVTAPTAPPPATV